MYLFDEISRKLGIIENQVKKDSSKLFGHEWRDWRIYHFTGNWLAGVPALAVKNEKDQLLYLFGMEFIFFNLLEQWKEYFKYDFDSVLVKQYLMNIVYVLEPIRKQLGISINGKPKFEAEYFCKSCNAFYYHKSPFEVHCFKCESLLDFSGIIPVEKMFNGFSTTRIPRYFGEVTSSIKNLDL
jgi:hypothetical protein